MKVHIYFNATIAGNIDLNMIFIPRNNCSMMFLPDGLCSWIQPKQIELLREFSHKLLQECGATSVLPYGFGTSLAFLDRFMFISRRRRQIRAKSRALAPPTLDPQKKHWPVRIRSVVTVHTLNKATQPKNIGNRISCWPICSKLW